MKDKWTLSDIPDLTGKTVVVTGGNKGLGFKCSLELARKGADVVIGCRDKKQGEDAKQKILKEVPVARVTVILLDLLHMKSIEDFVETFKIYFKRLDILLNNAGVVNLESLNRTKEGYEMHMATNHLGHFALTHHLMPLIMASTSPRVVTVSSGSYRFGVIDFNDFDWKKRAYDRGKAYGDSKLANLLFMRELQHRFDQEGIKGISVSAHPGLTGTKRQQTIGIGGGLSKRIASPVSTGVLPLLRAATDPFVVGSSLYGPKYFFRGNPVNQKIRSSATNDDLSRRLWQYTEKLLDIKTCI